jgi:hypothetical protein
MTVESQTGSIGEHDTVLIELTKQQPRFLDIKLPGSVKLVLSHSHTRSDVVDKLQSKVTQRACSTEWGAEFVGEASVTEGAMVRLKPIDFKPDEKVMASMDFEELPAGVDFVGEFL